MESLSTDPTGPTVLHTLLSARFVRTKRSRLNSLLPVRLEHTGTTHIIQLNIVTDFEGHWLFTILRTL